MQPPVYPSGAVGRALARALVLPALLGLTGCFTLDTLIHVQRDGSGTVEEVFVLSGPMLQMLAMFGGEGEMDLCAEDDLRKHAAEMGRGVALASSSPIKEDGRLGCKARYTFKDINALRVEQDPGTRMPASMDPEEEKPEPPEYVTFRFTPGAPARLVVQVPQHFEADTEQAEPTPVDSSQQDMQLGMMREMLKGSRVRLALAVDGTITQTDASYREGRQITLVDVDFDELLEDEEQFARLQSAAPRSAEEVKALLKDVKGVKVETNEAVYVLFN